MKSQLDEIGRADQIAASASSDSELQKILYLLAHTTQKNRDFVGDILRLPATAAKRRAERNIHIRGLINKSLGRCQEEKVFNFLHVWLIYKNRRWEMDRHNSMVSYPGNDDWTVFHRITRLSGEKVLTVRQIKNIIKNSKKK